MECPVCQSESPEGKKFCAECGAELPHPQTPPEMQPVVAVSTAPKRTWCSTHLKGLFALAIVLVVVLASVSLIYTQPWSKIKVIAYNQDSNDVIRVVISIDKSVKATLDIGPRDGGIVGIWAVDAGAHLVEINYDIPNYPPLTDLVDPPEWAQEVQVGPFYTKNVWAYLS